MNKKMLAHGAALSSIAIWSCTYIFTKELLASYSPLQISLIRFAMGALVLIPLSWKDQRIFTWKEELKMVLVGFLGIFLYYFVENLATLHTYASNVSILVSTIPIISLVLNLLFNRQEPWKKGYILSFLLVMAGLLTLFIGGRELQGLSLKGDLLALLAALIFAVYTLVLRKFQGEIPLMVLTQRSLFYGWIFILISNVLTGQLGPELLPRGPEQWLPFLFLGLLASGYCFVAWAFSVKELGALRSSQYIYAVPLITMSLAAIQLNEALRPFRIVGLGLLLLALILSQAEQRKQKTDSLAA